MPLKLGLLNAKFDDSTDILNSGGYLFAVTNTNSINIVSYAK